MANPKNIDGLDEAGLGSLDEPGLDGMVEVVAAPVPPPTPASAGNGVQIDAIGGVIYGAGQGRARKIYIANRSVNTVPILVNVSGMHAPGEFAGIEPSKLERRFRASPLSIGTVTVKTASGTAVIDWQVSEV